MKVLFYFGIISVFIACDSTEKQASPEELRMELQFQEQKNPLQFLEITEGMEMKLNKIQDAGLFSDAVYDGYIISGMIKNSASIARFKDVVVTVQFFSATETLIAEAEDVFYEYYEPSSSKQFILKVNPPSDFSTYNVLIKDASSAE